MNSNKLIHNAVFYRKINIKKINKIMSMFSFVLFTIAFCEVGDALVYNYAWWKFLIVIICFGFVLYYIIVKEDFVDEIRFYNENILRIYRIAVIQLLKEEKVVITDDKYYLDLLDELLEYYFDLYYNQEKAKEEIINNLCDSKKKLNFNNLPDAFYKTEKYKQKHKLYTQK